MTHSHCTASCLQCLTVSYYYHGAPNLVNIVQRTVSHNYCTAHEEMQRLREFVILLHYSKVALLTTTCRHLRLCI